MPNADITKTKDGCGDEFVGLRDKTDATRTGLIIKDNVKK